MLFFKLSNLFSMLTESSNADYLQGANKWSHVGIVVCFCECDIDNLKMA